MSQEFKPTSYNSVSPYFIVNGAQKLIDLLITVFDAKESRRYMNTDGSIMHAEVMIDDSVIMLSEASKRFPAIQQMLHVYVPNVDVVFNKAIDAGCEVLEMPKENEGDPDRRGTFIDFTGNMWSVATQTNT